MCTNNYPSGQYTVVYVSLQFSYPFVRKAHVDRFLTPVLIRPRDQKSIYFLGVDPTAGGRANEWMSGAGQMRLGIDKRLTSDDSYQLDLEPHSLT